MTVLAGIRVCPSISAVSIMCIGENMYAYRLISQRIFNPSHVDMI